MSPITFTQQGIITQCELAKILIVTSDGLLEVALPLTDDERRAYHLSMFFSVPKDNLISHPNFWYFFGYFDMKAMAFANPVFIVPSAEVHSHASPRLERDRWTFTFSASLDPSGLAELDGLVLVGQRP